jgi:hypothetical protein
MRLIWTMIISLTSVHASLTVLVRSKEDSSRREEEKKDPPHTNQCSFRQPTIPF